MIHPPRSLQECQVYLEAMDGLVSDVRAGWENTVDPDHSNCGTAARLFRSATDLYPATGKGHQEDYVCMSDSTMQVEWLEWVVSYLWRRQANQNNTVSKAKCYLFFICFLIALKSGIWSNIWNTRDRVIPHFQTPRTELKIQQTAKYF